MSYAQLTQAKIKAYDTTSYTRDYTSFFELTEYNRTYELCNEHTVGYHSGNVIKFFSYTLKKPFIIGNRDGYMSKKLDEMRAELNVVTEQVIDETITDEMTSALLADEAVTDNDVITDNESIIDTESVADETVIIDNDFADDGFSI